MIDALSAEIENLNISVDRVFRLNNVNNISDDDLHEKFGIFLGISKYSNESSESYRTRLKIEIQKNGGGTIESLLYAASSYCNINDNKEDINEYITICDAWEYTGNEIDISQYDTSFGNILCIIDSRIIDKYNYINAEDLTAIIENVKSAGTNVHVVFTYAILYDNCGMNMNDSSSSSNIINNENETQAFKITDDKIISSTKINDTDSVSCSISDGDNNIGILNSLYCSINTMFMTNCVYDIIN